jgi:hypothetical protein
VALYEQGLATTDARDRLARIEEWQKLPPSPSEVRHALANIERKLDFFGEIACGGIALSAALGCSSIAAAWGLGGALLAGLVGFGAFCLVGRGMWRVCFKR